MKLDTISRQSYYSDLAPQDAALTAKNRKTYRTGLRPEDGIAPNKGNNPASGRERIAENNDSGPKKLDSTQQAKEKSLKRMGLKECQTCKNRRYQDVSNDPGVSVKAPPYVPPSFSGIAVAAHENQHVVHEQARAEREGKKIVYQSV